MASSDAGELPGANGFEDTSGSDDDGDGFPTPSEKNGDDEASVQLLGDEARNFLSLAISGMRLFFFSYIL